MVGRTATQLTSAVRDQEGPGLSLRTFPAGSRAAKGRPRFSGANIGKRTPVPSAVAEGLGLADDRVPILWNPAQLDLVCPDHRGSAPGITAYELTIALRAPPDFPEMLIKPAQGGPDDLMQRLEGGVVASTRWPDRYR